jgi:hypothetical protein
MFDPDVLCQRLLQLQNFWPHDVLTMGQDGPHPIVNFRFVAPVLFFAIDEFHLDALKEFRFLAQSDARDAQPVALLLQTARIGQYRSGGMGQKKKLG